MNQPEDILSIGDLENLPDYTIFKKKTPAAKRYPSSARKTLGRWYLSFVKNNNPKIKYKYWISVNGYLENKTLIQSSPILDIEGPLVINTANTKYYLINNSDVLKNPPHSRFDLKELTKFTNGFPPDWKEIVAQQLTEIFGACRIKSTGYENDKLLTPFDKIYNEVFNYEDKKEVNKEIKKDKTSSDEELFNNLKEPLGESRMEMVENLWKNNFTEEKIEKVNGSSILMDKPSVLTELQKTKLNNSYMSNSSLRDNTLSSVMNNSIQDKTISEQNSSINKSVAKNQSNNLISAANKSNLSTKANNQSFNEIQSNRTKNSSNSDDIEIVSKSINKEGSLLSTANNSKVDTVNDKNIPDIFLEDNINSFFGGSTKEQEEEIEIVKEVRKPSICKIGDVDISSISEKLIKKEGKSFDNVMNVINSQKTNKSTPKKQNEKDVFMFNDLDFDKILNKNTPKKGETDKVKETNKKEFATLKKELNTPVKEETDKNKKELITPKKDLNPPKKEVNTSKKEINTPVKKVSTPKKEISTPKKEISTPKKEVSTPKNEVSTPKKEISTPKKEVNTPKKEIATPKKDIATPKKEVTFKPVIESKPVAEESDLFINSSFNVPDKCAESLITNMSKLKEVKKIPKDKKKAKSEDLKENHETSDNNKIEVEDLKFEDYLQDSHIIESILNLGNIIENSSFKPNDSDKVNLSIANKRKKIEVEPKKKTEPEVKKKVEQEVKKRVEPEIKKKVEVKKPKESLPTANKSLLEEAMNSRVRRPYTYEDLNVKKKSTPKKKKLTKNEGEESKIEESKIEVEESKIEVEESKIEESKIEDVKNNEDAKIEDVKNNEDIFIDESIIEQLIVEKSYVNESKLAKSKIEVSKVEESKIEESKIEESKIEESNINESKIEQSTINESKIEESNINESKVEESKNDDSTMVHTNEIDEIKKKLLKDEVSSLNNSESEGDVTTTSLKTEQKKKKKRKTSLCMPKKSASKKAGQK